jgi:sugar lactone lactonase YvrE
MDLLAGRLMIAAPGQDPRAVDVPGPIAAFARPIRDSQEFVVVGERDVWRMDLDDPAKEPQFVAHLGLAKGVRANDGDCSPRGVLHIGTMDYDGRTGAGSVLALDPQGPRTVLVGTAVSNGMHFLSEEEVIFIDSGDRTVGRYRLAEDGSWILREVIVQPEPSDGLPDGMCADIEGGIWVALWDGGRVVRYLPDGRCTDVVSVPVARPTAATLGGPHGRTLFITSSAVGSVGDRLAGAVFSAEVEVPGAPVHPWHHTSYASL